MAYQPASTNTTSGSLQHQQSIYFKRRALDNLKQQLVFMSIAEADDIPRRSGKTAQWYRHGLFGANTTPSAEGTVGTGLTPSTSTISATVSQYSDHQTLSTLLMETDIAQLDGYANEIAYRAALSTDTIIRNELESNSGNDDSPQSGGAASVADLRTAVALLKAALVRPRTNSDFVGIFHPYITHDIKADNTGGGFIDITKYADPNRLLNSEIGKIEGVRVIESTNVFSSNGVYANYIVGAGAIGAVSLAGSGPGTPPMDPNGRRAFNVHIGQGGPEKADPEGNIGAFISYRFVFTSVLLDETTLRYRTLNAQATLV